METKKTGFLEESAGVSSSNRLGFFIIIGNAILSSLLILCFGLYKFITTTEIDLMTIVVASTTMFSSMTAIAVTLKLMQKPMENK